MKRRLNIPRFAIGSAVDMARDPLVPEVVNVSVRIEDQRAFRSVIATREKLIDKKIDRFIDTNEADRGLIDETMNCAINAAIAMTGPTPDRERARSQLTLTAAMAIAALGTLKTGS